MRGALVVVALAACAGAQHDGSPPGRQLAPTQFHAYKPDAAPDCQAVDAPTLCSGHWMSDVLQIGSEGGEISAVYITNAVFIVDVVPHHSCGAYLPQSNWRLLLPEPRRPIELRDVGHATPCSGQP